MQAAAKPSKPAERDELAPKERDGDDNNGPSQASQPAPAAGGSTPAAAAASGGAQGNGGGSAGPSSTASAGDRRYSTDRRRTAGKRILCPPGLLTAGDCDPSNGLGWGVMGSALAISSFSTVYTCLRNDDLRQLHIYFE